MVIAERHPERAKYLADKYSVLVTSVADAAENAAYVVVAVKPTDVERVIGDIADAAARADNSTVEQVFVTVAAGVTTAYYEANLPAGSPVIRVMPNAPVVVGGGVSALAPGRFATAEQLKDVSAIFDAVGGVLTVPEAQLDAVTACPVRGRVLLPDGRGARRCGRRGRTSEGRGHRSGRPNDGRIGGNVAGRASTTPIGRRGGNGHVDGHQPRSAAGHRDVAGGTTAAGLRNWSGGACGPRSPRRSSRQKHALSS